MIARLRARRTLCLILGLGACAKPVPGPSPVDAADEPALRFLRAGSPPVRLARSELERAAPPEQVSAFDPYYKKQKTFRALPLLPVLARAYPGLQVAEVEWVLRARDGFTVPIRGAVLAEPGAYIAIADEGATWELIEPKKVSPGPFYLVWKNADQLDPATHPRPWQLDAFEVARFEDTFPHVVVPPSEGEAAARGFATFRGECIACHAINREGGHVGPEMNVPQSIVEYRPVEQIKAYIRKPLTFRYSVMPPHPALTDGNLDDLIAYFRAMSRHKFDWEHPPLTK